MRDEALAAPRIGGSEVAAIFHRHEFLDEFGLWVRKKGKVPPEESNERMMLGKFLEQGVTAYAAALEGWEYEWCDKTERSEVYPFMVYTPDALIPSKRWGIDAKVVFWDQAHHWGPNPNRIPHQAIMQAWWYMAGMDYEGWYIVALVLGEGKPRIYPIERDREVERFMLRKAEEWWKRYIVGDEQPLITESPESHRWLKKTYPRERGPRVERATEEEEDLLFNYADTRQKWDRIEKQRRDLEARIKLAIGDRAGLEWPGGKFTWKLAKDSQETDWEALAKVLVDQHPAGAALLKEFTHSKPGSRRMYFKSTVGAEVEA